MGSSRRRVRCACHGGNRDLRRPTSLRHCRTKPIHPANRATAGHGLKLAPRGCAGRQRCELGQGLRRLRRVVQVAPADAREPGQVGEDRGAQFGQQVVEGKGRVGFGQERLDGVQPLQEARGQFDPVQILSHACWRPCQSWWRLLSLQLRRGAAEAGRWRHRPPQCGRPRCLPGRAWHRRSAAGGCARAPGGGSSPTGQRR